MGKNWYSSALGQLLQELRSIRFGHRNACCSSTMMGVMGLVTELCYMLILR